jgi:hypothetical protein
MLRPTRIRCALIMLVLLGACAPAPTATRVPTSPPKITVLPSSTPAVQATDTPAPTPAPLNCPVGYSLHVEAAMGFSACYPEGWLIVTSEDPQSELMRVTFNPPQGSRGAELRFISVSTTPALPAFTDEEFLQQIDNWLQQEYYERLLTQPHIILVDEHRAVDAAYEARVVLGREVVDMTRWVTALRAHDRRWFVDVAGRTQYRDELEHIRAQFLAYFRISPS